MAERMIHRAIELGINYFDTGHSYRKGKVRESQERYGRFLSQIKIDSQPVFDGMAVANGRVYISLIDGEVVCFGD